MQTNDRCNQRRVAQSILDGWVAKRQEDSPYAIIFFYAYHYEKARHEKLMVS
jgi:hypothetical protein